MLGAFAASNLMAHESGLLTVTIMGMWMANMKDVEVDDILEFKETLSVLLISGLFILLASRIELSAILNVGWGAIIVLVAVMFVARPLGVFLSSFGTGLNVKELSLLAWIAPRGIVAAAVSALFSLKLEALDYAQVEMLVPMVFLIIIATVVVQSLTSAKVAKWLGMRAPAPNGYLIFGGAQFSRMFATELMNHNIPVCLADTNWETIKLARMDGVPTYFGNPMSEHASRNLDLTTFGSVLVMSPYRQLNPLVTYHFEHEMGKGSVLALSHNETQQRPSHQVSESYSKKLGLFAEDVTYGRLAGLTAKGASVKTTSITDTFTYENYQNEYKERCLPLCAIDTDGRLQIFTTSNEVAPKAGWKVISLISN
jgi:hypothetical protein